MNYERIYRQFIEDRRCKPEPEGYTELHHILPRSMGGGDEPDNLIRMTPEDHYFAHLCLAKWHGGMQWASVVMMGMSRKDKKRLRVRARYMYGAARRQYSEASSKRQKGQPGFRGDLNGMYDRTEYSWTNVDTGEVARATKGEMWELVGGCRAHWTSVVTGERKTMLGWTIDPERIRVRSSKGKVFNFANDNGETFEGTQGAFAEQMGVSLASASRIARGLCNSPSGWRAVNDKTAQRNCEGDLEWPPSTDAGLAIAA